MIVIIRKYMKNRTISAVFLMNHDPLNIILKTLERNVNTRLSQL